MSIKSNFIGYVPLINGGKAEMWLETGWDETNFAFIVRLKLIDPNTGQPIGLPEPKNQIEIMEIGKAKSDKAISKEMMKMAKGKEESE